MNSARAACASLPTVCRCSISDDDKCVSRDRSFEAFQISGYNRKEHKIRLRFPLKLLASAQVFREVKGINQRHICIISLNKTPSLSESDSSFACSSWSSCIVVAISGKDIITNDIIILNAPHGRWLSRTAWRYRPFETRMDQTRTSSWFEQRMIEEVDTWLGLLDERISYARGQTSSI